MCLGAGSYVLTSILSPPSIAPPPPLQEALEHLSLASSILRADHTAVDGGAAAGVGQGGRSHGDEVFSNYATALRRAKRFHEATEWYQLCLSVNPTGSQTTHMHVCVCF